MSIQLKVHDFLLISTSVKGVGTRNDWLRNNSAWIAAAASAGSALFAAAAVLPILRYHLDSVLLKYVC